MLTVLKLKTAHCCKSCDPGRSDTDRHSYATWMEATEAVRMAVSLAVDAGFDVMASKPGRVELERSDEDVLDELTLTLMPDSIGRN